MFPDEREECRIERLGEVVVELRKENDTLRGLLAKGSGPCAYCGLPAEDIAKCAHGFPGCGRMDDIISAPILQAEATLAHVRLSLEKLLEKL